MSACVDGVCQQNPFLHGLSAGSDGDASADQPEQDQRVSAVCPFVADDTPPIETVLDVGVPEVDREGTRFVDLSRPQPHGRKRLSNRELDERLAALEPQLIECMDLGACYADVPIYGGDFDIALRIAGTGRVLAVSVATSDGLQVPAIVACARRRASTITFPKFTGTMSVRYVVTIE